MRFDKKTVNKVIGKIDRYFTWDSRYITNGKSARFHDDDRNCYVSVNNTALGLWCFYRVVNNGKEVKNGNYCTTFREIREFLDRVMLIG